ncbi:deoxyribose-phosphate aldolase, partial [archaeon]
MPLATYIDHTLLKPNATIDDIKRVCDEAIEFGFASVCVNSHFVGKVSQFLAGSRTKPISVIGFPLGAMSTAAKAFEAREAVSSGALEIDMVINIGALRGQDYGTVLKDIQEVVAASRPYPVKVILETALLSKDEIVVACVLSKAAGAAFVKTCTGFGGGGATVEDVRLMRSAVGPDLGVKASGGVRSLQ